MLKLNNSGDTIVEVLVSLAILSLAFAISYSTASRALIVSQNSQEHSTALGYLDQQMEMLWYISQPSFKATSTPNPQTEAYSTSSPFCLTGSISDSTSGIQFNPSVPYDLVSSKSAPQKCLFPGGGFSYSVALERSNNTFTAYIWWPGLGNLGEQHESLTYRVYKNE